MFVRLESRCHGHRKGESRHRVILGSRDATTVVQDYEDGLDAPENTIWQAFLGEFLRQV
jgi:hypothetical protein